MSAQFSVRVAEPGDFAAVGALLEASYPKLFAEAYEPGLLARALPLVTKANPRLLASGAFYLAETATGQLVGCGGWSKERPGSGEIKEGEGHVRHFATHPEWIRRGIGSALLSRCFRDAEAQGIGSLTCYSSLVAVAFYRASGFADIGPMTLDLAPDVSIPGRLMRCDLLA